MKSIISKVQREDILRQEIVRIGQKLYAKSFVAGADGNLSARLNSSQILITPSGRPKGELEPEEMVVMNLDGSVPDRSLKPSSEYKMHVLFYNRRPEIEAVVHAHPPVTTALSTVGHKFPADFLPESVIALSRLAWVEYATPSTAELPALLESHLADHDIFVLKNHGVTAVGRTLEEAYLRLEACEHTARIYWYALQVGTPETLGAAEAARIKDLFLKES